MRSTLLPLAALLFCTQANAQLNAGEVPNGMSALDLNIDLVGTEVYVPDTASFDLDCDGEPDMKAVLFLGAPEADGPHLAELHMLDGALELCMEQNDFPRPKYYAFGQPLECQGDFDWQSDDINILGSNGGWMPTSPLTIDSLFIAYRRGSELGWILLSYDLIDDGEVRLWVHQVLTQCSPTMSVAGNHAPRPITLFPNPSNGETINVKSAYALRSIDVLDATGRTVAQYNGTVRTIPAPEVAGAYLVRFFHSDERRSYTRLVRQ